MYKQKPKRPNTKKLLAGLVILLLAVSAVLVYRHDHRSLNLAAGGTAHTTVKGTVSKPTQHTVTTSNGTGQGGIIDQSGQTTGSLPPASQWVTSDSGNITLQQPSPNTTVTSGATLSGLAKTSSVRFILTDDSVGLIAEGGVNVVNGKFSGVLQFTPHAKTGKLQVYYPNPTNGAEEDIIEIGVTFNAQ